MKKKQLSERDICTKYITPALEKAGWDIATQIREEFPLTRGRVIVRGKLHTRAKNKRADEADVDFNKTKDRHLFNDIYEKILADLQSAGNASEYYTPCAVTQFMALIMHRLKHDTGRAAVVLPDGFLYGYKSYSRSNLKKELMASLGGRK